MSNTLKEVEELREMVVNNGERIKKHFHYTQRLEAKNKVLMEAVDKLNTERHATAGKRSEIISEAIKKCEEIDKR